MRILWVSNDPRLKTGYGTQTAQVVPRLAADGHDIAILANAGMSGRVEEWEGITVFPQGHDLHSNEVISATAKFWQADQIIVLYDPWPLDPAQFRDHRAAVWCPIDRTPIPPRSADFFARSGATPIAMSQFGARQLEARFGPVPYVPHGIDMNVFQPTDRKQARERVGLPADRFIVGMVSTNKGIAPSRKAFDVAFRTFSAFCRAVPEALLYVHSNMLGSQMSVDLSVLATHYAIPPDNIVFADQFAYRVGFSDEGMALLYSSFDVLSFATMGEGFGIPAVEAQACGTPVICSNFSAQPELTKSGWLVDGQLWWDEYLKADLFMPSDRSMLDALAAAYQTRGQHDPNEVRANIADYDADLVYARDWRPVIAGLEPDVAPISVA
jgi:glycosyltransferase involved in cell wall biosynthesis